MKDSRLSLKLLFLLAMGTLSVTLCAVLLRFALPAPGTILVGRVEDFPAGAAPKLFWQGSTPFYVLNEGSQLIALAARSQRGGYPCLIQWNISQLRFVDPCWGSRMRASGEYAGGGPPWEMQRLQLSVDNGQVWVEADYR